MRNLSRVILILALLLLISSVAAAKSDGEDIGPFSTTGYTTNLVENPFYNPGEPPSSANPPLLPSAFTPLPSGHTKFHISAEGGPHFDPANDALCKDLYGGLFPPDFPYPISCQTVCLAMTGQSCGTTGMFEGGSFTFEEWGVYYPPTAPVIIPQGYSIGANHGLLNIITGIGEAHMRFGGQAVLTFEYEDNPEYVAAIGSFDVLDGTGNYKKLKKGQGTYDGDANVVFTVDYTPCEGKNCPEQCAVFGDGSLNVKKDKIEWRIENEGRDDLTVSSMTLNWQGSDVLLDRVKLGGKTLDHDPVTKGSVDPDVDGQFSIVDVSGWEGRDKDIQLRSGKNAKMTFEFEENGISQEINDYTILVEFAEGCAVTFVAFD